MPYAVQAVLTRARASDDDLARTSAMILIPSLRLRMFSSMETPRNPVAPVTNMVSGFITPFGNADGRLLAFSTSPSSA